MEIGSIPLHEPTQRVKRINTDTLEWETADIKKSMTDIDPIILNDNCKVDQPSLDSIPYDLIEIMFSYFAPKSIESYCLRLTCKHLKWVLEKYTNHPRQISTLVSPPHVLQTCVPFLPQIKVDIMLSLQVNALRHGDWNSFWYLYQTNDCSILSDYKRRARLLAIIKGDHISCLKKLQPLHQYERYFYHQVFHNAAELGAIACLKYALYSEVEINTSVQSKFEAMISAATKGHLDIVKYLSDYVANSEAVVISAAMNGHLEIIKHFFLIWSNLMPGIADDVFWTAVTNGHLELAKYASSFGVSNTINAKNIIGIAARRGHVETIKYLISLGIVVGVDFDCIFRDTLQYGNTEMIDLISLGVDIGARDDYAIRHAAEYGHLNIVVLLVSVGANVQARDNNPLLLAAINGHINVIKYLVSCGAKHPCNRDVIKLVQENGNYEMIDYLESIKNVLFDGMDKNNVLYKKYCTQNVQKNASC